MKRSVREIADFVHARVLGDENVELCGISSLGSAMPGDLVFGAVAGADLHALDRR